MRKFIAGLVTSMFLVTLTIVSVPPRGEAVAQQFNSRTCATMDHYAGLIKKDPQFAKRLQQIEVQTQAYVAKRRETGPYLRSGVIRIPVVVHVVYNQDEENITDEQIQSQIDALNLDFRMANADSAMVPDVFKPLRADTRIEFQLAVRDPNCGPTTGITRTSTTETSFQFDGDPVKFAASGGHDAWPSDKYLNLWVCDLAGGLLGYGLFPGVAPEIDGVVVDFEAFGTMGTAAAPFDLGRTAAHEIGHWLNLRHIWGDDSFAPDICTGTDFVDDTPNQGTENTGCPAYPSDSCGNAPDGDMFMNYMDYTDDLCMMMFSVGQSLRMDATLNGARSAILGSDGLIPPPPVALTSDLWSQDTADDIGNEPNNDSTVHYLSDDIWVRNQNDGTADLEHQNPIYRPAGPDNYVYVRVRNRGCTDPASGTVKLYWAKASSGLAWPQPWDGTVGVPALMGNPIGTQATGSVPPGGFVILAFPWAPPNPADYASFGADSSHFCLLSRIETDPVSPFGMTFPEGGDLGTNVKNNNNIVWKNISIVTESTPGGRLSGVTVGDLTGKRQVARVIFGANGAVLDKQAFDRYKITVDLGEKINAKWVAGGRAGSGIISLGGQIIQVTRPGAWIGNLSFNPFDFGAVKVRFAPLSQNLRCTVTNFNLTQLNQTTGRLVGGEGFVLKERCR
jgi:hypothetical protein